MLGASCNYLRLLSGLLIIIIIQAAAAAGSMPRAPALYVFGDSLFDSGNNDLLPTLAQVNYQPYGIDFPHGATGRFTNGRNLADFIADYLGLPYPPPILGISEPGWVTGFNYASGACGILPETGAYLGKCLSLEEQIDLFEKTVKDVIKEEYKDPHDSFFHLSKSIFIVSIGNNDYITSYFGRKSVASLLTPKQFSELLIHQVSLKLQRLYKLGARKVVFFELGPIGCMPNQAKTTKHDGLCNKNINRNVSLFNIGLRALLPNLSSTLSGSHFILGQAYGLAYDAIIHPSKYGLRNSKDPCCQALVNNTLTCIRGLQPCTDRNQHFFWDGYHPTQSVCSLVASGCINDEICAPLNIQQLLQL